MNWTAKDVHVYTTEREYIDTAIIPLMPVILDGGIKRAAEQGEFIQLLSMHLERQFRGRTLMLPPFAYVKDPKEIIEELESWSNKANQAGFSYVFYLTSDSKWQSLNESCNGTLIYMPSIPLEHMDEQHKHSVIDNQLKSLIGEIINAWQRTND
ncbi:YpiF family protein [Lederbergia citri]|uniref:YpiF family protein n=1 Tax=Lederbergia citri TaxID=2833580 RepID=A0A942YGA8_9BACI|nr:YpiF family protein [Lederbergia citri]MBS4194494.1 YpiF family protein [Lederbergia citri]